MINQLRIAFMGTPPFAAMALAALIEAQHKIVCVYTQPPRPAYRGKLLTKSAVHDLADTHELMVRTPQRIKDINALADFAALDLDVAVVAAYGQILPSALLNAPRQGCINIHASLLPRWRGAAPIQRALMAGDRETGISIMQMETGLDTGPVAFSKACPIETAETSGSLHKKLGKMGAEMIVEALANLNMFPAIAQPDHGITYAQKIDKAEARLDFTRPAEDLERLIRAMQPAPGAWFEYAGERIKIIAATIATCNSNTPGAIFDNSLSIVCGDKSLLRPSILQRAGRSAVTAAELLRGFSMPAGTQLL